VKFTFQPWYISFCCPRVVLSYFLVFVASRSLKQSSSSLLCYFQIPTYSSPKLTLFGGKELLGRKNSSSTLLWTSQVALVVKNPPANAGEERDADLIPGSGGSPGVGNGNPLQYSCLENSMDRGDWWAPVHEVAKQTQLSPTLLGL